MSAPLKVSYAKAYRGLPATRKLATEMYTAVWIIHGVDSPRDFVALTADQQLRWIEEAADWVKAHERSAKPPNLTREKA